jgi:polyhydroxyalkanoate synthesis regulator phasin
VMDALRGYVQLANGLTEVTRQRAQQAAKALLQQSGAESLTSGLTTRVSDLADEIVATSKSNRQLLQAIVANEVEGAVARLGFARVEEVAALTRRIETLEREVAERHAAATDVSAPAAPAPTAPAPAAPAPAKTAAKDTAPPKTSAANESAPATVAAAKKNVPVKKAAKATAPAKKAAKATAPAKKAANETAPAKKAAAKKAAKKAPGEEGVK